MGCDGLWDVFTNQYVCDFILKALKKGIPKLEIAKILSEFAIENGSTDNVTVIIVFL